MESVYRLIDRLSIAAGIPESAMVMEVAMQRAANGCGLSNICSGILMLRRECALTLLVLDFWPPEL